ncbi:SDR family oxidoreductase [Croceitalea rosinachiae]|uniref:SDR family oxidoreductase n=1 Tax=Croceitalea rosinachiae TaxID=3075596 RepID=A0ABU3ABU2_9FLAO|nr:SDR family oxidoreductase [Croceitalea sp. F388]MDT0607632.1 SDR family oxidoreductase [Croceitalea sp. F388]
MKKEDKKDWALILGGSSGLGLATAIKLSKHNFNIIVIHRDKRSDIELINDKFQEITSSSSKLISFNADATNGAKQKLLMGEIAHALAGAKIKVLVHSIAKGNLKPMYAKEGLELQNQDFNLTIDAMAVSFYDWVKLLVSDSLFTEDARAIAFTSEGNSKAWVNYGAVSAAKAALEAIMRNIALEFASVGVKANCIQAGITLTKSFEMIPGSVVLKESALERNPNGRLTTPEDVANALYLLTMPEAKWITGTIIKVDGGESLQ